MIVNLKLSNFLDLTSYICNPSILYSVHIDTNLETENSISVFQQSIFEDKLNYIFKIVFLLNTSDTENI